jgi:hypothetical protein
VHLAGGEVEIAPNDERFTILADGITEGGKVDMILGRVIRVTIVRRNSDGAELGGVDCSDSGPAGDGGRERGGGEGEGEGEPDAAFVGFSGP